MARSTKDAWLKGPGDLATAEVEDVPVPGESVLVRGLPAAYSNQASREALKMTTVGMDQIATVDTARLEVLQFAHGVIEPEFTVDEAQQIAEKYGPAFKKVIAKIDALSGVDKEAITDATARFPSGGESRMGQTWVMQLPPGVMDPMFTYELAETLHMTVQEMMTGEPGMSAHELTRRLADVLPVQGPGTEAG